MGRGPRLGQDLRLDGRAPGGRGSGVQASLGSPLRLLHDAADEIGRLPDGARVLDVPCGGGVALRGMRVGQEVSYTGVDVCPAMLDRTLAAARRRGLADRVRVRGADVGDLPFDDGSFDLVLSLTGLHCFPDPAAAVAEMVRVVRPGGRLVGSTILDDAGPRWAPMRVGGRLGGILGPGVTSQQLTWLLADRELTDVRLERSGALGYFSGAKPT